jgi:NAD(P)-dependent dehydrogenase (short-subunit alcohol dehydrogenase family)
MMSPDNGPVVFITGAATGIGAACARIFARAGWRTAIGSLTHTVAEAQGVMAE